MCVLGVLVCLGFRVGPCHANGPGDLARLWPPTNGLCVGVTDQRLPPLELSDAGTFPCEILQKDLNLVINSNCDAGECLLQPVTPPPPLPPGFWTALHYGEVRPRVCLCVCVCVGCVGCGLIHMIVLLLGNALSILHCSSPATPLEIAYKHPIFFGR